MSIIEEELINTKSEKTEHGETLKHLSDDENFAKKSLLLTHEQAYAFATLWSIATENDIVFLKNWLKNISDWNISVNARGRDDIVEVSKYKPNSNIPFAEKMFSQFDKK